VPGGDSVRGAARRLQVLVGQRVAAETPHPRAAVKGIAAAIDGRRLEAVEAIGKNLLLSFEGGVVVRSHLRMKGRWHVGPRGATHVGRPWLVLRGDVHEALLWNGSVLELDRGVARRLGPDILARPPDFDAMLARLRAGDPPRAVREAFLDQRAFAALLRELDDGVELPFAFEEHASRGRPALYEYRPLVRAFVDARAPRLARREDARLAVDELAHEPAAAIFARAHAGARPDEREALYRSILLPLLVRAAEGCGGVDWGGAGVGRGHLEVE